MRATIGWKPVENLQAYLVWEHFSENDDRMRSAKQLCRRDEGPSEVNGVSIPGYGPQHGLADGLSQGCLPASPYSADSFQTPNGQSLSFLSGLQILNLMNDHDPYLSTTQSQNLRVIESSVEPAYKAKNDIVELNADYTITPELIFSSQTGFSHDFLYSTEDYNRFNTAPGVFNYFGPAQPYPNPNPFGQFIFPSRGQISPEGVFCDPQLGCSDRLVGADLDELHSWQLGQEFRVSSKFSGPLNFSFGGNYLHYEIDESYYVFINALTILSSIVQGQNLPAWSSGNIDNHECLGGYFYADPAEGTLNPFQCGYIDPNPISSLNGNGHNYFRSHNPYVLNSYAGFGEAYYDVAPDLKFIGGLRWTDDQKHFPMIPSFLLIRGWGSYVEQVVNQEWSEITGRAAVNWTPKLDFTDQTLVYASFAHGYKAGGANPPGATLLKNSDTDYGASQPTHPLTFAPEFINAYELGTKNTLLDGALTLNGDFFFYDYKGYQISQIIDRTSVNINVDARVKGAELEAAYEPMPGLRFNFAGGWEHSEINKGQGAIDLIDRTAGHSDWLVLKPTITRASNCIIPAYVVSEAVSAGLQDAIFYNAGATGQTSGIGVIISACQTAYDAGHDPLTDLTYVYKPTLTSGSALPFSQPLPPGYIGFDPATAPNNGAGFDKELGGNELPNTPPFTVSAGAQYTVPISNDWAGTLRADYYWQDYSWARIFNDNPYDRLRGYTNVNLTLILTNQAGWQVMLYDKNVFNTTDITGTFLNSDDSGLTTNVFTTDPRLIGIRVTKNW
jgi:outer membrane receptor protein involved in Fe transport